MSEVIQYEQRQVAQTQGPTPAHMLQVALEKGASMEQLEKLLALQERWEANEARKAFAAAMAAFRAEAPVISKNAEVDFTNKSNNRTQYKHASLDHITAKVNPILGRHGLTYSWVTEQENGTVTVHCDLMHVMGHRERVTLTGPRDESGNKNSIQSIGSACTYLQRYTLVSALGLSTGGQDDDGAGSDAVLEVITDEQATKVKALLAETNSDEAAFLKMMKCESIEHIPAAKYAGAMLRLNEKKEKQSAA